MTQSHSNSNNDLVKLGGLWKNQTKDGKTYLSGNFGGAKVLIFPNGFKTEENQPDYTLSITQIQPKKDGAPAPKSDPFDI